MSSATFAIELQPSSLLRGLLFCCGALAAITGVVLLAGLPLPAYWRAPLALLWLGLSAWELRLQIRGGQKVQKIRLDAGGAVSARDPDGDWLPVSLRSGSVVLAQLAWLCLELPDGGYYGELLYRGGQKRSDWHGLQLMWRQRRGAFGGHSVS